MYYKIILLPILLFVVSCGHVNFKAPSGFVQLEKTDTVLKLYASDASIMRVTYRQNQKNGTATFWKNMLKRELLTFQEYKLIKEQKYSKNSWILKFSTPYRYKGFIYEIAILSSDDDLYIVELGSKKEEFNKHHKAFMKMLKQIKSEI